MEEIIAYKTQGNILRSKMKWYNEVAKNTKYFHNLEKRHFNCPRIDFAQKAKSRGGTSLTRVYIKESTYS